MAEPNLPTKRLKTEDGEYQFFQDFLNEKKNEKLVHHLRKVLREFRFGVLSNMAFLRVAAANAISSVSFSDATIDVAVIRDERGFTVLTPIALLFLRGFGIIMEYMDEKAPKVAKNMLQRQALRELLQFWTKDHTVFSEYRGKQELAVRFARHLMISLVPQKTFVVDAHYSDMAKSFTGCCSVDHPVNDKIGDTTFGVAKGWHGRVDILIPGKEVPLKVIEAQTDLDSASVYSDSSVEVKIGNHFSSDNLSQIMAQTIVFSFLQHKEKVHVTENNLVPGIIICAEKLIIFLYDCEEDVLLQSRPIELFSDEGGGVLNMQSVLVLWLVLNYRLFGSGVPNKYKQYKAKFHQILGPDYLQIYREEVTKPLNIKPGEKKSQIPDWETAVCYEDVCDFIPKSESVLLKEAVKQKSISEV